MNQMEHVTLGSSGKSTGGTRAPYFDGSQVCAQVDPELFFPETAGEASVSLRLVTPICRECSFRAQCLDYAVKHSDLQGIWAGTTERHRRVMRRRLKTA